MSDVGGGESSGFWRKHIRHIPGRPSPKNYTSNGTSFQNFKNSVDDVWDCGLEDSEFAATEASPARTNAPPSGSKEKETGKPDDEKPDKKRIFTYSPKKSETSPAALGKFTEVVNATVLEVEELKRLSWSGIPSPLRAKVWRLLAGYLPANVERREEVLTRKRSDYTSLIQQYYHTERDEAMRDTFHQIHIDVPRMSPIISLFQQKICQEMFERILFIWAIRHPASGYVQGINDLVTPFFVVFLEEALEDDVDLNMLDLTMIGEEVLRNVEADSFWCFTKFLDSIQDNYIFAQTGIQEKVRQLKELISRTDNVLHNHLQKHGIDYLQFSFRWMNNLLTRELPLRCSIRLWDTYLAESDCLWSFQLYVCAAFLLQWRRELIAQKDFQGLMINLQNLPTQDWNDDNISMLVAEAFKLKYIFADAPNHLTPGGKKKNQSLSKSDI